MRSASLGLQPALYKDTAPRPETGPVRSRYATSLTLAAMSLGYGVVQLDVTIVNTALHAIGTSLGGGVSELQWVVSAYTIAFAAFILTAGALGDRIGAKRIFMAGFALFTAASAACALAPSAAILIAARCVQGLAAAILVPNSLALLSHAYADEKARGRAVAVWAAGASLALTAGPFVGGALITLVGWRSIFLVNLPIGLAGLWLTWRYADETTRSPGREIDLPGQITAIAALGALAGAIIEGGSLGWENPFVIAGFAAFAVFALLFVWRETARRAADAAAVAVRASDVCIDLAGRPAGQYRALRPDLRAQPVLPAGQRIVGVRDRPCFRADDGRGAAGQPDRAAHRRAVSARPPPSRPVRCCRRLDAWRRSASRPIRATGRSARS